jgi:uncharacterized protein (TIGR03437 family)
MRKSIQWSLGVGVGILLVSQLVGGWGGGASGKIQAAQEGRHDGPSRNASGIPLSGGESGNQDPIWSEQAISQTCTLGCQATVPTTGQLGAEVMFQSLVEASGCGGTPSFRWDFGDGSPESSLQNPGHTYAATGTYQWRLTTRLEGGPQSIGTIAGGLGEGVLARQATLQEVPQLARDPLGRGVFLVDASSESSVLRFINTTSAAVTISGRVIEPGVIRSLGGGGLSLGDNIEARAADLAAVSGLAISPGGELVYLINALDGLLRVINISGGPLQVQGSSLAAGQIRTLVSGLRQGANAVAVHPTSGVVHYADTTPGVNRVFRVEANGTPVAVVGNGMATQVSEPFSPGPATSLPLLLPRALRFDPAGNLFVADTGHGRVIRVDSAGNATLVHQFSVGSQMINAYPSGLAIVGGSVYSANGNQQTVTRLAPSVGATLIAGQPGAACEYLLGTVCGDGGPLAQAGLYLFNSASSIPLASLDGDGSGLYLADQGPARRARIRYLNLSGTSVTLGGVTIAAGTIQTIGGNGLVYPFDGGAAASAALSTPVGVSVDPEGNLWIADSLASLLRFVNRGSSPKTLFAGTSSEQVVPAGAIVTVNPLQSGGQLNGPVIEAGLIEPQGVFSTSQGLYIVDSRGGGAVPPGSLSARRTSTIRFVNTGSQPVTFYPGATNPLIVPPGEIVRIAGGGDVGRGDGGWVLNAVLIGASDITVAPNGTIYIADVGHGAVRRIDPTTGIITSLSLPVAQYTGLGVDATGHLYIANYGGSSVLQETAAGSGVFTSLVGGLTRPRDVAIGADGTVFVTVSPPARTGGNHVIVAVRPNEAARTIVGGAPGFSGDGGTASQAQIRIAPPDLVVGSGTSNQLPKMVGIVVGRDGELLFTDSENHRIRRLASSTLVCEQMGSIEITAPILAPVLSTITPASALQNSGPLSVTLTGANFTPGSVVRWNGADRVTTYLNTTVLQAGILAADLAIAGTAAVTVFQPGPGGGTSGSLPFTVVVPNPMPVLSTITPNSAPLGGGALTVTVIGAQFVPGSVVRWNGQDRATSFLNSTVLQAVLPATDFVTAGTAAITVFNPAPGGGSSAALGLMVGGPPPTLTLLDRSRVGVGGSAFFLLVTGSGFDPATMVRINQQVREATYLGPTQLRVQVSATDLLLKGTLLVTASNAGAVSNGLPLEVIDRVTTVLATSYGTGAVAPNSILSAFAPRLAEGQVVVTALPLPRVLAGTRLEVEDQQGVKWDQELFFVAPGQINYLLDPRTALGPARVTAYLGDEVVAVGDLVVERTSPGLFTQNASGEGVPAGYALRIRGAEVTVVPILTYDAGAMQWRPIGVDLGTAEDLAILVLFGSGVRDATQPVTARLIKGQQQFPVEVLYAGPTEEFVGLDQINLLIPRQAAGAGEVGLQLEVDGKPFNAGRSLLIRLN